MNLGRLRASLREMLGDQTPPYLWPDKTLDRFLNNAVREACLRARLLKADADTAPTLCALSFDAGQKLLTHAPEILVVRSGHVDGVHHRIWSLTAESMDRHWRGWENDCQSPAAPRYLVMDIAQKTLRLVPTPDAPGVLRIRVWRTPLESEHMRSLEDCPAVYLPDAEELRHWAAHEAYLIKDSEVFDPTRSASHLALFEQRFGARPSLHEMARWADSPPRVRHAHVF